MMGPNTDSEKNQKSRVGPKFSGHSKQHKNWCLPIQERQIRWVLAVLLFSAEFQIEPLALNSIPYDTRPTTS